MSISSWFRFTKLQFPSAASKPSRRPTTTRPFLETLEERAVPTATSNNLLGGLNNATTPTAFNTQQSALILTATSSGGSINGLAVGNFPNQVGGNSIGPALGALASPLAQNQLSAQLRALGINSEGTQGQLNLFTPNSIVFSSYGFGSGTQPNAPWAPNAYNLGLANGQSTFPSMADFGSFQSFGIRYPRFSRLPRPGHDGQQPERLIPPRDALAAAELDQTDELQPDEQAEDEDNAAEQRFEADNDFAFHPIPIVAHAETVDINGVQAALAKQAISTEQTVREEGPTADLRADNTVDEAVQVQLLAMSRAYVPQEDVFALTSQSEPAGEQQFLDGGLIHEVPALESLNLPSTLLLTVLTPAQLMLLMAEFPVAAAPSEREEAVAEYSELE